MLILHSLFGLITYCLACLGVGGAAFLAISQKNKTSELSPGTETATRFLLGQGLLANIWVLTALTGSFSPPFVNGSIALLCIAGIIFNYKLLHDLKTQATDMVRQAIQETWGWKITILAVLILWMAWITSMGRLPHADGSGFYLALAKTISASEQLAPLPGYENLTSIGLQGEMHFAALMTLNSPEATQLFSWLTLTAGGILLLALGRQVGLKRHGQWLAFGMIFSSSALIELSGSGKTDMYAAAMAFGAYTWLFNIRKDNKFTASILTGAFSGLAVVAKISYLVNFLPSFLLLLAWKFLVRDEPETRPAKLQTLILIGASATLMAVILPIKNQMLFENPIAPYGMEGVTNQDWYGPETLRRIYSLLPLSLTFGDHWAQIGNITPLVLMFLPLLFFLPKAERSIQSPLAILGIAALIGLACWFLYRPAAFAPRYFLGCLFLLVLPPARAAEHYADTGKTNRRMVTISTMVTILLITAFYSRHIFLPKQTYDLLFDDTAECKSDATVCYIESRVNTELQTGERVFMNGALRYWLRPDLIQCALSTEETQNYLALETANQRWSFIVGRGFRSVLAANRLLPLSNQIRDDLQEIPDWLDVKIEEKDLLIFLRLTPLDDRQAALYECRQANPPAWEVFEVVFP